MFEQIDALIGQMFVCGFSGLDLSQEFMERYRRHPVGGVILFGRNCRTAEQVRRLTSALKDLAGNYRPDSPLLIAVDQEGGNLSPLRGLVTSMPGNMGLAATGDPGAACFAGYAMGLDLRALGINVNLAPVLDLALQPRNPAIGTRAFSDEPERVAAFGAAFAKGLAATGTLFAAKHFPGHGSCLADSHVSLPVYNDSLETLITRDVAPFREVLPIRNSAVMVAHVRYDCLDPESPASLSPRGVRAFLRNEMGFDGVAITDCLEMAAIQGFCPVPEAAVRAVEAGIDIVLVSHTPELQEAAFRAVKEALASGRISLSRVEESLGRIARWKAGFGRTEEVSADCTRWTPSALGERVVTFTGGKVGWVFNRKSLGLVTPEMETITPAENPADLGLLEEELQKRGVRCYRVRCSMNPREAEISKVAATLSSCGITRVAVALRNTFNSPGQRRLVELLANSFDVLLVCIRDPREILAVGDGFPAIFTYSCEPVVIEALARVLCGEGRPMGRLPVSLDPAA